MEMRVNMLFNFGVILVVSVTVSFSFSQDVEVTETPEATSDVICSVCACADGIVDCADLNITAPFEITDWEGLQSFQPTAVDLSNNLLSSITRISKLPIQILNFSNCDISTIEDASFIYLKDLTVLDLSRNKISTSSLSIKVFFGPLDPDTGPREFKRIQSLSLAYNDLHSLPQYIFVFMSSLTSLDMSGNPLAYIDQVTLGAISDLTFLKELKLSSCELETLPEGLFRKQRKLKYLDLSNNQFSTIPSVLQEAKNLVYLNLDKNAFRTLNANNALNNLTKLQELHMSRLSRLQNVTSGALGRLPNLAILHLNHNPRLSHLDPRFLVWKDVDDEEQWPLLKELYLNNNNFSGIDPLILDSWNDLEMGDFTSNPYNCDCNNQWMVDVLVPLLRNTPAVTNIDNMVCKKPSDLKGLTFAQLFNASKTLVCPEIENLTEVPVSNMALVLGFMIGIIVTFPLVLILVLLWRRGFFSKLRQRKGYPRDYDDENEDL